MVSFGFGLDFEPDSSFPVPAAPLQNIPEDQHSIEQNAYDMILRFNSVAGAKMPNAKGYVQNLSGFCIDTNLNIMNLNTVIMSYLPKLNPKPYYPLLDRAGTQLIHK
jgi:hypothetical protein